MEIRHKGITLRDINSADFKYVISLYMSSSKYDYAFGINKRRSIKEIYDDLNNIGYSKESINMIIQYVNTKVGIIRFYVNASKTNQLWINYIIIEEKFQNMGIGKRVISILEEYFHRRHAINAILISVIKDNRKGVVFWLNNGYKIVAILKEHVKVNNSVSDIILMKKEVSI